MIKKLFKNYNYNKNYTYFILPYGLGDTMIVASLKNIIEKIYNIKIHFFIKKNHEIILKLYNITDYTIVNMPKIKQLAKCKSINKIESGDLFIAHPLFINDNSIINEFNEGKISFYQLYLKFFNIPDGTKFNSFDDTINFSPELTQGINLKLLKIKENNLSNVVLLAPEANSCPLLPNCYWSKIAKEYKNKGYTVISNVTNRKNSIRYSKYIPLTTEEALYIAQNCAGIICLRSGFSDLISIKHKGFCKILYPNIDILNLYSIKRSYNIETCDEDIVTILATKNYIYLFGIKILKYIHLKKYNSFYLKLANQNIITSKGDI